MQAGSELSGGLGAGADLESFLEQFECFEKQKACKHETENSVEFGHRIVY